jgi:hypothetical protein
MRHLDEPFAAFGSVFSVARFRIVFADTSQLLMEQEVIPYRQQFHDYCREANAGVGPQGKHRTHHNTHIKDVMKTKQGTIRTYALRRLARERPAPDTRYHLLGAWASPALAQPHGGAQTWQEHSLTPRYGGGQSGRRRGRRRSQEGTTGPHRPTGG